MLCWLAGSNRRPPPTALVHTTTNLIRCVPLTMVDPHPSSDPPALPSLDPLRLVDALYVPPLDCVQYVLVSTMLLLLLQLPGSPGCGSVQHIHNTGSRHKACIGMQACFEALAAHTACILRHTARCTTVQCSQGTRSGLRHPLHPLHGSPRQTQPRTPLQTLETGRALDTALVGGQLLGKSYRAHLHTRCTHNQPPSH